MKKSILISCFVSALTIASATTFTAVHADNNETSVSTATQLVTSRWGTATATFDPSTGTLRVKDGMLSGFPTTETGKKSEFIDTDQKIDRRDVINIIFEENVSSENAEPLLLLDGTLQSASFFNEDFENIKFVVGIIRNPNVPYPIAFSHGETDDVYRAYNPNSGDHLYTSSKEEFTNVLNFGWKNEGIAYLAYDSSTILIYRVYNPNSGEHMFTTSKEEYFDLYKAHWIPEGRSFCAAEEGANAKAIYRAFNPNATGPGSHLFTESQTEIEQLVQAGWKNEGTAYFVPTASYESGN